MSRSAGPVGPSSTSASGSGSSTSSSFSGVGGGLYDRFPVMRVNARQTPVSHAALAHADSTACDELRAELERHLRDGGATVLVTPIVDPLIIDSTSFGGGGGSSRFPSMEDVEDALSGSGGKSLGSFGSLARSVDFDGTVYEPRLGGGASSRRSAKVLVEGTVCKCDPDDPGDCCARGLATYCTSCPVLASCDDPAHASMDALDAVEVSGAGVDCAACGTSAGLGGYSSSSSRVGGGGGIGECAFARAIKAAAATHTHRHQYYAAIVQTSHGVGVNATVDGEDDDDGTVVDGVGYEEFLVHRPAGDAWIAGALPPPTSVRRASFGPQLRGELRRLAVQRSAAEW